MGQALTIFDFRENIVALKSTDTTVSPTNHTFWKTLFLTSLTHDEVCAMVNFDDVRELRLFYTHHLAMLVYKCIEQLHAFAFHQQGKVMDQCAVDNALRMLGHMLPFLFEDAGFALQSLDKSKEEKGSARSLVLTQREADRLARRTLTPFGASFEQHFFWGNKTCGAGEAVETCGTIAWAGTLLQYYAGHGGGGGGALPPLGQILCQTLMQLTAIPGFTLYPTQKPDPAAVAMHTVDPSALWFNASAESSNATLAEKTMAFATVSQATVTRRRVEVLRTVLQTLYAGLCIRGRQNRFLAVLIDVTLCPQIPTLCASLLFGIAHYHSRGILPFTSHVGAEQPELLLAVSMELLCLVDDTMAQALLSQQETTRLAKKMHSSSFDERAVCGANQWMATMDQLLCTGDFSRSLCIAITRILENPLYSQRTWIKGSQKVVECQSEALLLLLRLLDFPCFLADFTSTLLSTSVFALVNFLHTGVISNTSFNDVQVALYILLKLSASRGFVHAVMAEAVPIGSVPIPSFPQPKKGGSGSHAQTLMDILVLSLCEAMSPSSPRWYIPLIPTIATVLANLATGIDGLKEMTCFELSSAMGFMAHRGVLAKGPAMVHACQLLVEAAAVMLRRRPRGTVFLLAHLAAEDFATKLRHVQRSAPVVRVRHVDPTPAAATDGEADGFIEMHDDMASLAVRPDLPLPADFFTAMPLEELGERIAHAKAYLDATPTPPAAGDDAAMEQQLFAMLDSAAFNGGGNALSAGPVLSVRQFVLSAPISKYLAMQLWKTVHRRNLQPPIFDFSAAKAEFVGMQEYA